MTRGLLLFCLAFASPALAQEQVSSSSFGFAGVDDRGNCVTPCARAGGRPCAPCLPVVGPGSSQWNAAVADTAAANMLFKDRIRDFAEKNAEYRASQDYRDDRKRAREIGKSVEIMRDVSGPQ